MKKPSHSLLTLKGNDVNWFLTEATVTPLTVVTIWSSPAYPPTLGFLLRALQRR